MGTGELKAKSCVPCRGGIPPLEPEHAREYQKQVPAWSLSDDATRISRRYTFGSFPDAITFVNQVAGLAEEEGHHPDFEIHYDRVDLILYTHVIGGLHENDFIMAAKIDELMAS